MDMDERRDVERDLREALRIETGKAGEWRYVTYGPVALGRFRQDETSRRYQLEWLAEWMRFRSESEAVDIELAEGWAVEQIASLFSAQARSLHG
jgi:hypothetical protein